MQCDRNACVIEQGQWVRVHPAPKRYPAAAATDWRACVIHLDEDVCVLNKPAGIPVQAHESNAAETVPRCAEAALGIPRLWVPLPKTLTLTGLLAQPQKNCHVPPCMTHSGSWAHAYGALHAKLSRAHACRCCIGWMHAPRACCCWGAAPPPAAASAWTCRRTQCASSTRQDASSALLAMLLHALPVLLKTVQR
jgi:hypothetical protein